MPLRENKDVMVYQREGARKLFLVAVDLENAIGVLSDITERLRKADINLLSGTMSTPGLDGVGRWSFMAEATKPGLTASKLRSLLESSPHVVACKVKESWKGMLIDSFNFPLSWNTGDRAIMIRAEFFGMMERKLREEMGTGADVLLYELGYEHALPSWKELLRRSVIGDRETLQEFLQIYSASGWGRIEVVSFDRDQKSATLRVRECFECLSKDERPSCNFVRGHLVGALTNVFGRDAKAKEVACISGGSAYCEFVVTCPA